MNLGHVDSAASAVATGESARMACGSGEADATYDADMAPAQVGDHAELLRLHQRDVAAADATAASRPEFAAQSGKVIGALVYFSSASENTARFVAGCRLQDEGINVYRIPLKAADQPLNVREPYVIMVPTYGGGVVKKAVPIQVKRFLNDRANREWIRGVIASGNTNFGEAYCAAGDIIAAKCHVPFLYKYELMGTPEDTAAVRDGLVRFFAHQ